MYSYIKITSLTLLVIMSGGWIGDGVKGDCLFMQWWDVTVCNFGEIVPSIIFALIIFILSTWFIFEEGSKFFYRNLKGRPGIKPHRVMIIAVSALQPKPVIEPYGSIRVYNKVNPTFFSLFSRDTLRQHVAFTDNISNDIKSFDKIKLRANIQQLLRAIEPHIKNKTLERIFLIGSSGKNGSFISLNIIEEILKGYNKGLKISCHNGGKKGFRFEEVEDLRLEYEKLVTEAKKSGYKEHEIILDATGGQKTASIAAAMTTFGHKNLKFQYVETGKNPRILTFNIVAGSAPKII